MPDQSHLDLVVELAKRKAQEAFPKEYAASNIESMGPMHKRLATDEYGTAPDATTSYFNDVRYNPDKFDQMDPQVAAGVLIHELMHVRQNPTSLIGRLWSAIKNTISPSTFSYGQDPNELEAYQAQHDWHFNHHDVIPPGTFHPFLPGNRRRGTDIPLGQ